MRPCILVAYSASGGGHGSVAAALVAAIDAESGHEADVRRVDVLERYAPWPYNRLNTWYPTWVGGWASFWRASFAATDHRGVVSAVDFAVWPGVRGALGRLFHDCPADVTVCVHPLLVSPLVRAPGRRGPFVTVTTDLVSGHAWWYDRRADLVMVPTDQSRHRAISCGVAPERVRVAGLPVGRAFVDRTETRAAIRSALGWTSGLPVVMVMGGADGVGALSDLAHAIAREAPPCELVIVAGRNGALRDRLASESWPRPTHVYGFVEDIAAFMHVASVLVTKAGPSTIAEAFCSGLPLVLFGAIPGQEAGNVRLVVETGAGVWAPGPRAVVRALDSWLGPAGGLDLHGAATRARAASRPTAAEDIARIVWQMARAVVERSGAGDHGPEALTGRETRAGHPEGNLV
jgi:1,2-diacylglycerol 3-beta-galactosyltransferase